MAGYKMLKGPEFANVLDVKPVTKTVRTPRQVCHDIQVTHQAVTKDPHQITGSVARSGGGGVLGNQVGGGSGKKIATVAGAAAGGYAGNRVQKKMQQGNTATSTEQRCETVYDSHEENLGYDVRYILDKKEGTVRMDQDPGRRFGARWEARDRGRRRPLQRGCLLERKLLLLRYRHSFAA